MSDEFIPEGELPEWQIEHLKKQLEAEIDLQNTDELKLAEEPESTIQSLIKETYKTLRDRPKPDEFDKFWENNLKHYGDKWRYAEFLLEVIDRLNIRQKWDRQELKQEKECEKALFKIAENVGENPANLESVRKVIEQDYPDLVSNTAESMSPDEYRHKLKKHIEKEVKEMAKGVKPKEKFKDYFDDFKALNNNDIDDIAYRLNQKVDLGQDVWKLLIYSTLSAPADKFIMGGRPTRSSIHTLLIGDISTAKSKALSIIEEISPKADQVDDMTKASFIGSYDTSSNKIKEGIVDRIQDGNLIIEEYDKIEKHDGLMRVVFDNSSLSVSKGQDTKEFDEVTTSILTGANPKNDFFTTKEDALRGQIPFKEGELSRFDVLIPLTNTSEQMEKYTQEMELFGSRESASMDEAKKMMRALSTKINEVDKVEIDEEQEQRIKDGFNELQEDIDTKHRPTLIIMRDLETLVRLVNIIGCVYLDPDENQKIEINEEVVNKALSQFETLIDLRKRLYTEESREKLAETPKDKIYNKALELSATAENQKIKQNKLKDKAIESGIVNNKPTFYEKLKELKREEKIAEVNPEKDRYKEITPVADTGGESR
jgi:DNA replicative helicase MCM subunit Mcm2 (Cdc46/Mcm family)